MTTPMMITEGQFIDLVRGFAAETRRLVEESTAPLLKRIMDLEAREPLKGDPGKDADADAIVAQIPLIVEETVTKAITGISKPKDGIGLAAALIDQDGILVLTLSDGTLCKLGRVHGRDGAPGKDGKDGLGYEDLEVVQTDERDVLIRFVRGDEKKEFPLRIAGFVDRGVYAPDAQYQKGDGVTWGGCLWLAQRDTAGEKPNAGSDAWRLAVKCGRDGKDGRTLPQLPDGPVKSS